MRLYHASRQFYKHFRKFHTTFSRYVEIKTYFQSISYENNKVQNYLNWLKDQYLNRLNGTLYSNATLQDIVFMVQDIDKLNAESKELNIFMAELKGENDEMFRVAEAELKDLENKITVLKSAVLQYLIPHELTDDKDLIMELSPGVGGQEAMLFNKDMFDMYCNFVQWKGWTYEVLKYETTGIGGLRCGHIAVSGKNAYKILKYESGVHRVQRIPKTERSGRIHTSTMTVAVMPQPTEIDIVINPNDIVVENKRSSGAGGQHVNTTDSACRIFHKPTGIIVESQVERHNHRNRVLAMKSLRAKLYQIKLESMTKEATLNRKLQVGTAGRSEKIRTYNYVQDRITDHRAHINLQNIESFFTGGEYLNKLLERLEEWNSESILLELLKKH